MKFPVPLQLINMMLVLSVSYSGLLNAQVILESTDLESDKWLDPFQPISFRLSHLPDPSKGRLAFFMANNDVTALMKMTAPGAYQYNARISPLPVGENTLTVYLIHDNNNWTELVSHSIRVLTAGGFEESELTARLDVSDTFQSSKSSSDFDPDPDRESNNELTLQGGLSTRHVRKSTQIQTSWNIVGSSDREQALRFAEKGQDAPLIDLTDYLIEVNSEENNLQLGHVTYGSHPLLMDNVSHRGLTASWRAFEQFDLSFSAQNGQAITGASDLLGFQNYDNNRINGFGLGFDLLRQSDSQLRVELTYIDAKISAEDNFNFGEVTDAELSSGLGIIIRGNNASGRLRGDIAFARSTFQNAPDPFLEQDFELVDSDETTDSSHSIKIEYDVLQASYEDESPWSLTVALSHSLTDPFYNSAGAFITPDLQDNAVSLSGQAGDVNWQLQYNETRDNLDDLNTILTTLNRNTVVSISLPVKILVNSESSFVPENINIDYQKNHQFGDNLPLTFDPDSHIPDQVSLQQSLGLEWLIEQSSIAYNFSRADQDNRQTGRENADFINTDHTISLNTSIMDSININLSLSRSKAEDVEQALDRMTSNASLGLDWVISDALSVSLNLSKTSEEDSADLSTSDSDSVQAQLSYQFEVAGGSAGKLPAQFFVRYSNDENMTVDNQFDFASTTENEAINAGLSISFF